MFEVELPASPALRVVKSRTGAPNQSHVSTTFRTSGRYIDPVAGPPQFIGYKGLGVPGFVPPKSGATGLVDEDASVILEFSEPIDLNTLDPSSTVIVERVSVGERVPGFIKTDPTDRSGRRFLFVPSVGFGSDEANGQGWDIEVSLTTGITDLAGNNLRRPAGPFSFRTRYVPGKRSASVITETFGNQLKMDPATVGLGGEWNTLVKGSLRGGYPTTFPDQNVQYTSASTGITVVRTRVAEPLVAEVVPITGGGGCQNRPNGSRAQMLYVPGDVGVDAAITGVGWGPSSNALFAADHDDVVLKLGHTSLQTLGSDFESNTNIGNPQQVYKGHYQIPQAKNILPPGMDTGYWLWPQFTSVFEWNGVNNLVFDAAVKGGTNCQILRVGFIPAGIAFPNRRAVSLNYQANTADFTVDTVVYDIQFRKRRRTTYAISTWYELASDVPIFAPPIVSPVGQPGGVTVTLEVEGAHGKPDPFNPGGFIADPTTATGFTTTMSEIDGHRFFRFRVTMSANLTTNQTATVNSVNFPYTF